MRGYDKDLLNKKKDLTLCSDLSFVIRRELHFYFNSKQQLFLFRKPAHENTTNKSPLMLGGSWR